MANARLYKALQYRVYSAKSIVSLILAAHAKTILQQISKFMAQGKSAGKYQVTFEASGISSGVYFYRLEVEGHALTQKMMLVK